MGTDSVLLCGGTVLTMNGSADVFEEGVVAVRRGEIEYVGTQVGVPESHLNSARVRLPGHLLLPGLVNGHTHLPMSLYRGLADDLGLQEWLEQHMFPAEAEFATDENVVLGTRLSIAELLLSGTTTCADGYFREDQVLAVAAEMGLCGLFGHGIIDFPAPGIPDPSDGFAVVERFLAAQGARTLQVPAVFPHAPYTCSAKTLRRAKKLALDHGAKFLIHVAESANERTAMGDQHGGTTPVRYLDELGLLDSDTILVHAVHVDEEEADLIAESGASVVTNTESNMKLASGIAPLALYLERGIAVGLGTDGCASNNDLDLFQEMGTTALAQRVHPEHPTCLSPLDVLRLATIDGARALGLADRTGSLEVGKRADIIAVRATGPHALPVHDPYAFLVNGAAGADVTWVMTDGTVRVESGRLVDVDLDALLAAVRELSTAIRRLS